MDRDYEELVRQTTKGNEDALTALFALGERYSKEGRLEEAVQVFKDSAISYRIAASRNLSKAGAAEGSAARQSRLLEKYVQWITDNPAGLRPWPLDPIGVDSGYIHGLVMGELQMDERCMDLFQCLESELYRAGFEFSSPGLSPIRCIWLLLERLFGFGDGWPGLDPYLDKVQIRVLLDPIADEIVRRRQFDRVQ